jgi:hypothetical protein
MINHRPPRFTRTSVLDIAYVSGWLNRIVPRENRRHALLADLARTEHERRSR